MSGMISITPAEYNRHRDGARRTPAPEMPEHPAERMFREHIGESLPREYPPYVDDIMELIRSYAGMRSHHHAKFLPVDGSPSGRANRVRQDAVGSGCRHSDDDELILWLDGRLRKARRVAVSAVCACLLMAAGTILTVVG